MDSYLVNLTSILDDLGATIEVSDEFALEITSGGRRGLRAAVAGRGSTSG